MSDVFGSNSDGGFRDLVPWADPYIAALIEKLRAEADSEGVSHGETVDELPPRSTGGPADRNDWRPDWSPRNWPRRN